MKLNIDSLLFNEPTKSIIMVFLFLYGGLAKPKLPSNISYLFNNYLFKITTLALLVYPSIKDFKNSLIVAALFYLILYIFSKDVYELDDKYSNEKMTNLFGIDINKNNYFVIKRLVPLSYFDSSSGNFIDNLNLATRFKSKTFFHNDEPIYYLTNSFNDSIKNYLYISNPNTVGEKVKILGSQNKNIDNVTFLKEILLFNKLNKSEENISDSNIIEDENDSKINYVDRLKNYFVENKTTEIREILNPNLKLNNIEINLIQDGELKKATIEDFY